MIKAVGEAPLNFMCPLHKHRNRSSRRFITPQHGTIEVSNLAVVNLPQVQSCTIPCWFKPNTSGMIFSKWQFMDTKTMSHCFQTSHLMPQEGFHAQQTLSLLLVEFVAENFQIWICKWKLSAYQVNIRHMII